MSPFIESTLSILGTFSALLMFLSPLPTISQIRKKQSVQSFSPDPYFLSFCNCLAWSVYALPSVTPNRLAPFITNVAGLAIQVFYLAVFGVYGRGVAGYEKKIKALVVYTVVLLITIYLIIPQLWVPFNFAPAPATGESFDPASSQSNFLGSFAVIFNVLMYAGPLTILNTVRSTNSVEFMPLSLTIGAFVCSTSWLLYGSYMGDMYIAIPNVMGVVLSLLQFGLYGVYFRTRESAEARRRWRLEREEGQEKGLLIGGVGI